MKVCHILVILIFITPNINGDTLESHTVSQKLVKNFIQNHRSEFKSPDTRSKIELPSGRQGMQTSGTVNILTVLIEFQDYPSVYETEMINARLFGNENRDDPIYPYESLKAFYQRSSYEHLNIEGNTLGWYNSGRPRREIAPNDGNNWDYMQQRENLIKKALRYFDLQGHDFSQYDNNNDGVIDYLVVIWSGPVSEWGDFWWGYQRDFTDSSFSIDGKTLGDYSWQPELNNVMDTFLCNTVIHETGHALGLPDYYSEAHPNDLGYGVGSFDMMQDSMFDHNPFSKLLLEWIEPLVLNKNTRTVVLRPSGKFGDAVIVMPECEEELFTEFFIIQYRDQSENDTYLPMIGELMNINTTSGLLIWHVDARLNMDRSNFLYSNNNEDHKLLKLVQADGLGEIEQGGVIDPEDYFIEGDSFGIDTSPASITYSGTHTGIIVDNITPAGETISFRVRFTKNSEENLTPDSSFEKHLYIPLVIENEEYDTYVGIVNPGNDSTQWCMETIGENGQTVLAVESGQSMPLSRYYRKVSDDNHPDSMWIRISYDHSLDAYVNIITKDRTKSAFVKASSTLERKLVVPHLALSSNDVKYWDTYSSFINGSDHEAAPEFDYISGIEPFNLLSSSYSQCFFNWYTDYFNEDIPENFPMWGFVENSEPVLAGVELFSRKGDVHQMAGLDLSSQESDRLYFGHIDTGGGYWWTGIALENVSNHLITVEIIPYSDEGEELLEIAIDMEPYERMVKLVEEFWTDKGEDFPINTAWIKVITEEGTLTGYELFGTLGRSTLLAGINAAANGAETILFPHIEFTESHWTGITVVNTGNSPTSIIAKVYDANGELLREEVIVEDFMPNQKQVFLARNIFKNDSLPEKAVSLTLEGTQPLIGFEIWGNSSPQMDYISGMLAIQMP